jgi:hypothetical protein
MEALVFGLIALNTINRKPEKVVADPGQFQPFDLRTLEGPHNETPQGLSSASDRQPSYVAQTAS